MSEWDALALNPGSVHELLAYSAADAGGEPVLPRLRSILLMLVAGTLCFVAYGTRLFAFAVYGC